jgi:hypothetical protein
MPRSTAEVYVLYRTLQLCAFPILLHRIRHNFHIHRRPLADADSFLHLMLCDIYCNVMNTNKKGLQCAVLLHCQIREEMLTCMST